MKRLSTRDISSFFTKKPTAVNASQGQESEEKEIPETEINVGQATQPSHQDSSPSVTIPQGPQLDFDIVSLPQDPGKRKKLSDFHPNERDLVRRTYIQRGPCQPEDYEFPQTLFGTKERRFNVKWFNICDTPLSISCIRHWVWINMQATSKFFHGTMKNSSMCISNMIGPVEQMALAKHPVQGLYFTASGLPQSLVVTLLSYVGTLRATIAVEKGFIDPDKLKVFIQKAYDIIFKASVPPDC